MKFEIHKLKEQDGSPFQKRVIRDVPPAASSRKTGMPSFVRAFVSYFTAKQLLFLFCGLVLLLGVGAATLLIEKPQLSFVRPNIAGEPLKSDDRVNIALLGVAGATEQGGYLTDSILIASLHTRTGTVSLLSLPRDLWIESPVDSRKINSIYSVARARFGKERALEVVKIALADFTNTHIDYAAVIDFTIFEDVIDQLGGIEMYIPQTINDPMYPDENFGFQRFLIRQGVQELDGATALKYARSRQTTSDYSRAARQQDLLFAMKEKAFERGLLTNMRELTTLYELYTRYVNTDISLNSAIGLAKDMRLMQKDQIKQFVLSDDPTLPGGLLYAPAKAGYGGQFVLRPSDTNEIDLFFALVFRGGEILHQEASIEVLNGSGVEGKATFAKRRLEQLGLKVTRVANYEEGATLSGNQVQLRSDGDVLDTLDFLKEVYDAREAKKERATIANDATDIRLILGVPPKTVDAGEKQ